MTTKYLASYEIDRVIGLLGMGKHYCELVKKYSYMLPILGPSHLDTSLKAFDKGIAMLEEIRGLKNDPKASGEKS